MDVLNSFLGFQPPSGINENTYLVVSRVLSIVFILLIVVVNVSLIFKNVRRCDFYLKPKNQTIISLAIGDLFNALYSLTALTRSYFESESLKGFYCSVEVTPLLYRSCLLNALYGFGLTSLGNELLLRHRISLKANSRVKKILIAQIFSAGPWLLAIVLMLPICSVSYSTSELSCRRTHDSGGVVASIIIPACTAVIVCIFVNCRVLPTAQYQQPVPTQVIAMTTVSTTSTLQHPHDTETNPAPSQANGYPAYLTPQPLLPGQNPAQGQQVQNGNPNVDQQPHNPHTEQPDVGRQPHNPHSQPPHVGQQPYNPHPQPPHVGQQPYNPHSQPPHVGQQPYNPHSQPPHFGQQPYNPHSQPPHFGQQPYNPHSQPPYAVQPGVVTTTTTNINTEKARLMSISICFLVCVLPYAIFQIGYENNSSLVIVLDGIAYTTISDLVMWFMVLRSYVTPAMMHGYSDA